MRDIDVVRIIDEARGFITGVRLLCIPKVIAWIAIYSVPKDSDTPVDYYASPDSDIEVVQRSMISGSGARKFLWDNLFNKVTATEAQKRELERYLKDYVNFAADADSGVVPSFVLWKKDAVFLSLRSFEYNLCGAVVYSLTNHLIVITLGSASVK
jgi:hypothetical protein